MQDLESVKAESRANVLVKAIGLDDEQIRRYEGILQKLPAAEMENRTYEDYTADCAQRRQSTCSQFTADKNGFTAHITLASENLVFFSVPYDDGFTAEQVKIETARCLGCGASVVDPNKCIGCGVCTTKCVFDAIHLKRDHPECSTMMKAEDKLKGIASMAGKRLGQTLRGRKD